MVGQRREQRAEARDLELAVGVAKSDQLVPGAESSAETGLKSGAVTLIPAVMHGLDISGVVTGELLGRLKGVIFGSAVIHDDDREGAGQLTEVADDSWHDMPQVRCLVEGGQEEGHPVLLPSPADFFQAGTAFQLAADPFPRGVVAERDEIVERERQGCTGHDAGGRRYKKLEATMHAHREHELIDS